MARADKHLLVYRRRALEEREAAAARRMEEEEAAARLREEQQAAVTLKQLGECFRTTQVIQLPTDRPKPTPKPRRYHVSPNLEEKVKAGVMLCWLKKGMKKMKEALKIGRGKDKGQVYHRRGGGRSGGTSDYVARRWGRVLLEAVAVEKVSTRDGRAAVVASQVVAAQVVRQGADGGGCNGSGKPAMGRRKIEMKRIADMTSRRACFSKRRDGLFKKASDLSILCGAEIAIVVSSPSGGKAFSFGHPSVDDVINRFFCDDAPNIPTMLGRSQNGDGASFVVRELSQQHTQLQHQLADLREKEKMLQENAHRESGERVMNLLNNNFEDICLEELEEFQKNLLLVQAMVKERINEILDEAAMHDFMMSLQ
ncbi:hypothetical protein QYE76_033905 [Lolium multiflorum]|uniref:MADS-box domain-containing protein n=1 Tax=Lolium multiflorum TaxID=4521 RepID=A0AAD8VJQ5_LOLMU|nr:hypothetical protein QYE76_033905 [Lolium multiflorum]